MSQTSQATGRLSAGHVIVKTLESHGVKRVYSVPGESYLDVLDGLHDSGIENVVCRHEGGATYMAEADGKMNVVPGVAMVTRGPGAANAHVGLHTAWQDSTALVLFVGLIPFEHRDRCLDPHDRVGRAVQGEHRHGHPGVDGGVGHVRVGVVVEGGVGAEPGASKLTKAQTLGIPILDEDGFAHLLDTGELPGPG